MKKTPQTYTCMAILSVSLFGSLAARATITNIVANPADYTSQATTNVNNSIASTTDAIGFAGGTPSWSAILMFPLPTLPTGKVIGNQTTLSITLNSVGASTTMNGDLWGIASFRTDLPTGTPVASFYYSLTTDVGPGANPTPTDAKLVNNFLTPSLIGSASGTIVTTVPGATNTLQNYIQGFYTTNTTYDASVSQAYVWLRINPDGANSSTAQRYVINAADTGVSSSLRPTLHLDIADPPASIPLTWNGNISALWDVNNAANWKTNIAGGLVYQDGLAVIFDDTLTGNSAVTLNADVSPSSVTFNNSATNYSISGSGKITGTNALTKLGTNVVVLDTANDYSGGTTLAGGILQVGNNDTNGSIGSGPVTVTVSGLSTLAFNRTDAISVNTIANGGGNPFVVVNSGSVTLAGASDNIGTSTSVNSGATLVLGKPSTSTVHALGTSSAINPGGTMQLGGTGGDQIFQNAFITNNGTFDLAGLNEGFNGMTGVGLVTNSTTTNCLLALGDGGGSATFSGTIVNGTGTVSLTKTGAGTQTLTGANTYTGTTTVSAGKLVVGTAAVGGGDYSVADNATLGVNVAAADASMSASSLTLGAGKLEFQNLNSTSTAPLNAASLVLNSTATINVSSGTFVPGQSYPLVAYTGLSGFGGFTLGTLPPGVFGNLDTSSSPIKLVVTSVSLTWNGNSSGVWDISTAANWKVEALTGLTYPDGEIVTFDDSLSGNPAISVQTVVSPASTTFSNNSTAYTISGPGYISGPGVLTKTGTNILILDADNDYFGGTVLAGGTLQIGNNDTHGAIGSAPFTNLVAGSILAYNRTDSLTLNNTITRTTVDNSAAVVINSGILTLAGSGDNSGAGATINSGATLILAKDSNPNIHALSSPNIMINPGGLLQLSGFGGDQIFLSSGMTDNGVFDLAGYSESFDRLAGTGVVTNSSGGASTLQLGENNGTATFGGTIVNGAGSMALTKIGTGSLILTGNSTYSGNTTVNAGRLVVGTGNTGGGSYSTANSATLGVNVTSPNGSLSANNLTLGVSTVSTLELQNLNSTTVAAINTPSLNVNSTVTVNVTSGAFTAGQNYPLLSYSSLSGSGSFVLGALPAGVFGTLNTASSPITLQVTSIVNTTPTNILTSLNGSALTLTWAADHTGWLLQSNSVGLTNPAAWVTVAGSTNTNSVTIQISPSVPQAFFRLRF